MADALLREGVKNLTECPICKEMYCIPKMLPCLHTFCLKCIEQYGKSNYNECDVMTCPVCRSEFNVPNGDFRNLKTNFQIDELITVQSASREMGEKNVCDRTSIIGSDPNVTQLIPQSNPSTQAIQNKCSTHLCNRHPGEQTRRVCRTCKISCCVICSELDHSKHDCCEVEDIKSRFQEHCNDVCMVLTDMKVHYELVNDNLQSFMAGIATAENEIVKRSEAIKQMVDRHKSILLEKLNASKSRILKNVSKTMEELQGEMMVCENFILHCQKTIEDADAAESLRIYDELKTKAGEISAQPISKADNISEVGFFPSELEITSAIGQIYGEVSLNCENYDFAVLAPFVDNFMF